MKFIIFNTSGEILRTGTCPDSMVSLQAGEGETVIEGEANDAIHYIDTATETVIDKPPIAAVLSGTTLIADGADSLTITNLPMPATVTFDGTPHDVPDGVFEFTVDLPGEYAIRIEALNHLPHETTVSAT